MSADLAGTVHVIACGVLAVDLHAVARRLGLSVELHFLPGGLHATPDKLRERLQETVDAVSALDGAARIWRGEEGEEAARFLSNLADQAGGMPEVSGEDYLAVLQDLCESGYLSLEDTISVPPDAAGFALPGVRAWPADPAPFNHPTKIAVLGVKRKKS